MPPRPSSEPAGAAAKPKDSPTGSTFTLADACDTGLPSASADFVWGEDAWCYVVDKKRLIAEAVRLLRPRGIVAFTDWVDGRTRFADGEADRYRRFMKFPNTLDLDGYAALLAEQGCEVLVAEDTGRFAPHVDLYLDMLNMQLTYDALRIIGFDLPLMESLGGGDELHARVGPCRQDRPRAIRRSQEGMKGGTMAECCGKKVDGDGLYAWFGRMIDHCYEYAAAAKAAGRPVVGILCEYTPRELIMAAGGVPVCLCGGSAKTIPAAEQHLPANLCPLIKSTYGYHLLRSNPFLEMADLVVGETTCDGKKKMYELMAETRPMYVLELPHKSDDQDAMEYWVRELEQFRTFLAGRFGTEVTDDKIREAICLLNRERGLRREVAALMKLDRPPLSGRQVLDCKSSIWAMPDALQQYQCVLSDVA